MECGSILLSKGQERQEGVQGQWQQESPFREILEQVTGNADTDCGPQTMRRAYSAMKLGNWGSFKEECRKEGNCEWTHERIQEAYDKVAMEDIGRLSIAQEILRKITYFLRQIVAPVDGMGGVTLSNVCPHYNCFPFGGLIWWVSTETAAIERRNIATGGVQHVEASTNEERPKGFQVVQIGANADRAKVFKAHAAPLGLCDNLISALKLLANQQKDGGSSILSIRTGLHERSRRGIMDGFRRFIDVDNVDVGDLRRGTKSVKVKKSRSSARLFQRRPSEK